MGTILFIAVAVIVAAALLDLANRAIEDGRAAARAALRRRYELRLIDDEGLARGLRSIDEAAA